MALEYVAAYFSYLDYLAELSDAECGRLFKACLTYGKTGTVPELCGNERFVWPGIKSQMDRDAEKYKSKCKKNSQNIRSRWDTNVYRRIQSDTSDTKEKEKEKEKEKAKEIKNIPPNPPQGDGACVGKKEAPAQGESLTVKMAGGSGQKPVDHSKTLLQESFDRFWAAYPRKVGKMDARKAWDKLRPDAALLTSMLKALEKSKRSQQWQKENGQFIPHPATWIRGRRWEDEEDTPVASKGGWKDLD